MFGSYHQLESLSNSDISNLLSITYYINLSLPIICYLFSGDMFVLLVFLLTFHLFEVEEVCGALCAAVAVILYAMLL